MKSLNWIAGIVYFKKRKNGVIGIIPGTDGPTAVYHKLNRGKSSYQKGNIKKRIIVVIASLCIAFIAIFCASRYGWRLFGFRYCSDPSMICVEYITIDSNDNFIKIAGNTSASAPAFIGATYKLDGATLYVGLKYNLLLGFFNRDGSFDIQIPIDNKDIEKIIIKGNQAEETIWEKGGPQPLNDQELSIGTYVSNDELSTVILQDNNEFVIAYSAVSYCPTGKYTINGDRLLLTVTDDEEYVFLIRNGKLVFESGTWLENWVEPGAEFYLSDLDLYKGQYQAESSTVSGIPLNDYRPMIFVKGNLYGDTGNYVESLSNEWKYIGGIQTVVPQNEPMVKEEFTANALSVGDEVYYSASSPDKVYVKLSLNGNDRYIEYKGV